MLVRNHVIISGIAAGAWYYFFKSVPEALVCFFSGFMIDIDHFLDYYANRPFTLSFRQVYNSCRGLIGFKKLYILLHGFELVAILWIVGIALYPNRIFLAAASGVTQHLIFDQIFNRAYPLSYFLTFRALNAFDIDRIIRRNETCRKEKI